MWRKILNILVLFSAFVVSPLSAKEGGETYLVGFAQDNMAGQWRAQQVFQLEKALKKHSSIKFIYTDAGGQTSKAIKDIEDLYDKGVDLLVVSPQNPALATPIVSRVYKSGIPVVLITRQIEGDDYTSYIGPDDFEIARMAADTIAESLNGKGRVLMIRGLPKATTVVDRTEGFKAQLKKYKNISLAPILTGNYIRSDAIKVVGEALEQGIQFDAIYAQSDNMAVGARLALKAHGLNPKIIPIVAIDYISEAREAIRNGNQTASFTYPFSSKEAALVIWDILQGKDVKKKIMVPSQKITIENVELRETIF